MEIVHFTPSQARRIILQAAGLAQKAQFGTGIEAVFNVIGHLGFVQVDTNYVVERAHHHALAARIPDYEREWLTELCEDGSIFETFFSDSSYMSMQDFRFTLPVKKGIQARRQALTPQEITTMQEVLDRVEREEALTVGDFENDRKEASKGWWDWRPAKVVLERLYMDGSLMIQRTKNFQKVYVLPANVIPADTDQTPPSDAEFARFVIRRMLRAFGIAFAKEIAWKARYAKGNLVKKELEKMVLSGEVRTVRVEGIKGSLYMLPEQKTDVSITGDVFILSPFDILNVFRHRLKEFFNFDYQIECFVPAAKRKYGYFSLPILSGETFIARMDAKADRKLKTLFVHNLHFEDIDLSENEIQKLTNALKAYLRFNQCREIIFAKSNREDYLAMIVERL